MQNEERARFMVFEVTKVNDPQRWETIVFPHQLWVRSPEPLFQELVAEKNLFKKVTLSGFLENDRTFDLAAVSFSG
jgi:hypothetical protein